MRFDVVTLILAGSSAILPAASALSTPRDVSRRHGRHHNHPAHVLANLSSRSSRPRTRTKSCSSRELSAAIANGGSTSVESSADAVTTSVQSEVTQVAPPPVDEGTTEEVVSTTQEAVTSTTKKATSTTQAAAATSTAASSGGSLTSDQQEYLKIHNDLRAQHGASALTWSTDAEAAAQAWANKCVFEHGGGKAGGFGENLSAGSTPFSIASALQLWVDEGKTYDASKGTLDHFTQMVWKSTKQVGCAVARCGKGTVFDNFESDYYVCEYFPPGNVVGQSDENVQA